MSHQKKSGNISSPTLVRSRNCFKSNSTNWPFHFARHQRLRFHSRLLKQGSTFPLRTQFLRSSLPGLFTNFLVRVVTPSIQVKQPFITIPGRNNTSIRKLGRVQSINICTRGLDAQWKRTLILPLASQTVAAHALPLS